ncbi:cysteine-rich receptor-like protein kinase 42 isoform X2 [Diospyros lotus]|nr:cysteine-rich receptor-like protein kinase 42 isoform X2 [Diospyros lotus]
MVCLRLRKDGLCISVPFLYCRGIELGVGRFTVWLLTYPPSDELERKGRKRSSIWYLRSKEIENPFGFWIGNAVTSKLVHLQLPSSLQKKLVKGREKPEEEEEDFVRLFNIMILNRKKKHFPFELWLFPVICRLISVCLAADSRIYEVGLFCGTKTPPANTSYIPYFTQEMQVLSQLVSAHHWGHYAVNATVPIYGLAQCREDLSLDDCLFCFAVSRTRLPHCLPAVSGRLYLDGCFLRYDDYNFFNESTDPARDKVNCSSTVASDGGAAEARKAGFNSSVGELLENVTKSAVSKGGFAVGEVKGVYGLAQCWETLSSDGCRACLEKAADEVRGCLPSSEGRGLNAGCFLRYSTTKFYNDGSQNSSGSSKTGAIIAIALGTAAFLMFSFFAGYACYVRFKRLKQERYNLGQVSASFSRSGLKFKYETLEKATDYFNPSKKLGQGGAGSVFKGTLPSGETVAVKRLFFSTRQWVDEFFNEVNLINGIQHKNLVKLLGCSIEGPESLLVYEYVPNNSLDQSLFDKEKAPSLSWKQRFDIIVGTAEGLAFLHGGSEIRIIHRDIKSGNILLDENFAPKIADFGLARCFGPDKSHLSTGIAGTL